MSSSFLERQISHKFEDKILKKRENIFGSIGIEKCMLLNEGKGRSLLICLSFFHNILLVMVKAFSGHMLMIQATAVLHIESDSLFWHKRSRTRKVPGSSPWSIYFSPTIWQQKMFRPGRAWTNEIATTSPLFAHFILPTTWIGNLSNASLTIFPWLWSDFICHWQKNSKFSKIWKINLKFTSQSLKIDFKFTVILNSKIDRRIFQVFVNGKWTHYKTESNFSLPFGNKKCLVLVGHEEMK